MRMAADSPLHYAHDEWDVGAHGAPYPFASIWLIPLAQSAAISTSVGNRRASPSGRRRKSNNAPCGMSSVMMNSGDPIVHTAYLKGPASINAQRTPR